MEDWSAEAEGDLEGFIKKARESMAAQVEAMVEFQDYGAEVWIMATQSVQRARKAGYARPCFPGFVPAYIRPLFCAWSAQDRSIGVTPMTLR
ncbi:MAG: hypothetical protein R2693_02655 [Nocardioidaceae bacterium]